MHRLIHGLLNNPLCVQVHGQVFQTFNFILENFRTIKIFIFYSQTFLEFQLD